MVSTSGFGVGVDIGSISRVIHIKGSYSLVDFVQETGRGERNGQLCVLFYNKKYEESEFGRYIALSSCRREFLQKAVNGFGYSCSKVQTLVPCDNCEKDD